MTPPKSRLFLSLILILLLMLPTPALSALNALSTDGVGATLLNLANGFPLWYEDAGGTKLELCLQQEVISQADGTPFLPCLTEEPILSRPISFPNNFGGEAAYYLLEAADTFVDSGGVVGSLLLVVALEAGFTNELVIDGTQTVFNRIRLRLDLPVPGLYRVTHPLGSFDYQVNLAGPGVRAINQTQDIGDFILPVDFAAALADGVAPAPGPLADPSTDQAVVNADGLGLTTFLGPAGAPPLVDTNGNMYLAEAGTELAPVLNPVEPGVDVPGVGGVDFFSVELLELADGSDPTTAGYFLNGTDSSQIKRLDTFLISGKIFNDGNNQPPIAAPDTAATAPGVGILIDVQLNDSDVSDLNPADPTSGAALNVHGLNNQALGIVSGTEILRTATHTTPSGATVRRITEGPTGKALLLYTPPADFSGEDSFEYIIQDTGGLLSAPTAVSITVEDLQVDRAEFRPKTGKWTISGTSSDATDNTISATTGPKAYLTGASVVPSVTTTADALVALRVGTASMAYQAEIINSPLSEVTEVTLHVGDPASNGPVIFSLFDSLFDPPLSGPLSGTLTPTNLIIQPAAGITSFSDAVREILAGNSYVSVLTLDNPDGEIRGQLQSFPIGSAVVEADGSWSIQGRAMTLPAGVLPSVNLTSANAIVTPGIPVQLR